MFLLTVGDNDTKDQEEDEEKDGQETEKVEDNQNQHENSITADEKEPAGNPNVTQGEPEIYCINNHMSMLV